MQQSKVVLVVEDDPDIRFILEDFLTGEGYKVVSKAKGREALVYLAENKPDLILLDMKLPDISGNDILQSLPSKALTIPVMVVSANTAQLVSTPQVKAVVSKPFDLLELLSTIEDCIRISELVEVAPPQFA
ncbi:MAG TPA: response regulator, partial [Chloroflexia bacterium]|nr:response regulator [Chloroflexia bacterium]